MASLLLAGCIQAQNAEDLVDGLEDLAQEIENLCDSDAAPLPNVKEFCDYALNGSTVPTDFFQLELVSSTGAGKCMEADSSSTDSQLSLRDCNSGEALQQMSFDGEKFYHDGKCLQAGRSLEPPVDGGRMRIKDCEANNELQLFDWTSPGVCHYARLIS